MRNWVLLGLLALGAGGFALIRSGPPSKAAAAEAPEPSQLTDAQQRYIFNEPHHWRPLVIKQN